MGRRVIAGKRVIITGASSGIGQALAIEACRQGARALATGRSDDRLQATVKECQGLPGSIVTLAGDLTSSTFREQLIETTKSQLGGLDLLINNAGVGATGHFQYAKPDRLRQVMEVNFFAPAELTRLAIPLLKAGSDPAIVMVSSLAGRRGIPSRTEYSASKFALVGLSEALRAELAKDDVEVTVVCPGLTATKFEENMIENNARHSWNDQRTMSSAEVAKLILEAVAKRKHEANLSLKSKLLNLANRIAPRFVDYKTAKFIRKLYADEIAARKQQASK